MTTVPAIVVPTRSGRWTMARSLVVVAAVAALFVLVVPLVSGAPWATVAHQLAMVPPAELGLLALLWVVGLLLHTITLTGALPGLTHRRALTLSLTGSAVANVLPVGGAAGIALNYKMARAWGHDRAAFAAYTVVTNVWDVLAKLTLPLLALPVGLLLDHGALARWAPTATVVTVGLGVAALAVALLASRRGCAAWTGRVVDRLLRVVLRRDLGVEERLVRLQAECGWLVRHRWPRLTLGMTAYTASLALLMGACFSVAGVGLAPGAVLLAFAVERLLTLAGLTPGGAGVVEVGLVGVVVALGGLPVAAVAAVLLYRVFTFGIEIPVGGAGLAAWLWAHR
ncbi:MAG: lysylphosphatidylglycerol synthase domain-containing protein [Nocardioides sp.]